jgi:hypothetical protein
LRNGPPAGRGRKRLADLDPGLRPALLALVVRARRRTAGYGVPAKLMFPVPSASRG